MSGGEVIIAPFDVYLDAASNAVQPDIIVILNSNKGHSKPNGHFHGVPDVIVRYSGIRITTWLKRRNCTSDLALRNIGL